MKLIDIEPVIEQYHDYKSYTGHAEYDCGYETGIFGMIEALEEALEVKAKVEIRAHWILERKPNGNPYCYHCSHCDSDFHHTGIKCASKYCPNCGATMAEEIKDGKIN